MQLVLPSFRAPVPLQVVCVSARKHVSRRSHDAGSLGTREREREKKERQKKRRERRVEARPCFVFCFSLCWFSRRPRACQSRAAAVDSHETCAHTERFIKTLLAPREGLQPGGASGVMNDNSRESCSEIGEEEWRGFRARYSRVLDEGLGDLRHGRRGWHCLSAGSGEGEQTWSRVSCLGPAWPSIDGHADCPCSLVPHARKADLEHAPITIEASLARERVAARR